MSGPASGVVLAGGRSSRFGSDKLAAELGGVPLLHHPVLRLAELTGDVVVVIGHEAPEPPMPPGAPVRFARDAVEGHGPLAGVLAGLGEVDARPIAMVVGGDMPELSTAVLLEMLRVLGDAAVDAAVLADGDGVRPLPVVVRVGPGREAAHRLLHRGERSLRAWLGTLRLAVIDEPTWTAIDPAKGTVRDVDEPSDLHATGGAGS